MDVKYFSTPAIVKTAGSEVFVWGKASDATLDSDQQILDTGWSAKALKDWFDTGANVRLAHDGHRPAGVGLELRTDSDGATWVKSKVVDKQAKKLVLAKVLTAYSVGIAGARIDRTDPVAKGGRITGGQIVEVSLVDRPANPSCGFQLVKSAGGFEAVSFGFSRDNAQLAALARKAAYDPLSAHIFNSLSKGEKKYAKSLVGDYTVKSAGSKPMSEKQALRMELERTVRYSSNPADREAAWQALEDM